MMDGQLGSFISISTVFQTYQNEGMIMKGCVQRKAI